MAFDFGFAEDAHISSGSGEGILHTAEDDVGRDTCEMSVTMPVA